MKKARQIIYTICCILALCCSACGFFGDQRYECDTATVESAQIIKLDQYVEDEYRYEYTILAEISECSEFVKQINGLKHSVNWGEPTDVNVGYIVIRIQYQNGDYDLLYPNAQWFNRSGVNQAGYFFFDEDQFNTLVSDWLVKESS